jgi:hypothetical protein
MFTLSCFKYSCHYTKNFKISTFIKKSALQECQRLMLASRSRVYTFAFKTRPFLKVLNTNVVRASASVLIEHKN